ETAVIAAVAGWSKRVDRLMAQLTGRAVVPLVHATVYDHYAANAGSQCQANHRRRASSGTQLVFGQAEGAGVIDHVSRQAELATNRLRQRLACPRPRQIDQESNVTALGVVKPRHPYSDRR